jgi:hypothetical protein
MVSQAPSSLAGADTLAAREIMHVTQSRAGRESHCCAGKLHLIPTPLHPHMRIPLH